MSCYIEALTLMAQGDWIGRFRPRATASSMSIIAALGLLAGVVALVWLTSRWIKMHERRRGNCPRALFRELCRAHGLSSSERNLLLRLSGQLDPYHPATLFLEPQRLTMEQLANGSDADALMLQRLREKLFGSLAR